MPPSGALPEIQLADGSLTHLTGDVADLLDGARTQALVLPVGPAGAEASGGGGAPPAPRWRGAGDAAASRYGVDLLELAQRAGFRGRAGETSVLPLPRPLPGGASYGWGGLPERVVLLGVGSGDDTDLRRSGAALSRCVEGDQQVVLDAPTSDGAEAGLRALLEGFLLAAYRPPRTGRTQPPAPPAQRLVVLVAGVAPETSRAVSAALRGASAGWTARRLAAVPANLKDPAWFAAEAQRLAGDVPGVSVTVHDESWLLREGMGGLLAVGSGSRTPPRLVVVDYDPGARAEAAGRHVVLVGKGVTFDSGGLSIKPAEAMIPMKTDMAGAAAALAAVLGAGQAELRHRVTGVLPLAENAVGAEAYRPGDVVRMHAGTTVEVLNTDAEGRLLLADALAWSLHTLRPDVVVDIATLTGAAAMGLGRRHAALYSTDEELALALLAAGEATGESAWRMPLVADYAAALDSSVADVANVATDAHVSAGSITAALFLRRFVGEVPWAHLDIAGPARSTKAEHEVPEGPTGYGARLLLRWLEDLPL